MKSFIYILCMVWWTTSFAQTNMENILMRSEWCVTKKWIGADTVILQKDSFPEFKGLDESTEKELVDNYWRSERIYFDENGELKDHHVYVFCPVGEDHTQLISFKIKEKKVYLKMKITKWGKTNSVVKTYVYKLINLEKNKIVISLVSNH